VRGHWTDNTVDHLVNIFEYISLNSPIYAKRMVDRITRRTMQISDQPYSGRKVPEYQAEDVRELTEKPHRTIIKQDRVDVVAVIHGTRLMPDELY